MGKHVRMKCPLCSIDFGQETKLQCHLATTHNVIDFFQFYLDTFCDGINPTCNCSDECTLKLPWNGWKKGFTSTYARGHNARVDSVWFDEDRRKEFVDKRNEGYRSGKYKVWNDGLTKETCPKIVEMASKTSKTLNDRYESGDLVDWRVNDPEKARVVAEKISETKHAQYASGELVPWNKGKTKETDVGLAEGSRKMSERYNLPDAGHRVKLVDLEKE